LKHFEFIDDRVITCWLCINVTYTFFGFISTQVVSSTGYLSGVFTPEEMDVGIVSTREAKAAFMQKLVQAISKILSK
jgi:hypothetical protein